LIEVNLLPGSNRKGAARRRSLALPSLGRLPKLNYWSAAAVLAWVAAPALVAWLYFGAQGERSRLEAAVADAQSDSIRYAEIIAVVDSLQAQRDTIAQKLEIIQEIDAGRYVWAHIMDEISWALPEYTWLTGVAQLQGGARPRLRIEGRTGNNIALTQFMRDLEDSPFLGNVRLSSTQQVTDGQDIVYAFMLEASYEFAPPESIETIPLFSAED